MATLKPEEKEVLTFDVSDEALEIAGATGPTFPSIFVGDQNKRGIAAECRRFVASVSRPEEKQELETLARAWDRIADKREARLLNRRRHVDS